MGPLPGADTKLSILGSLLKGREMEYAVLSASTMEWDKQHLPIVLYYIIKHWNFPQRTDSAAIAMDTAEK